MTAVLTTRADAQDTFVGLLTAPLVSARVDAARFRAVIRHRRCRLRPADRGGWPGAALAHLEITQRDLRSRGP